MTHKLTQTMKEAFMTGREGDERAVFLLLWWEHFFVFHHFFQRKRTHTQLIILLFHLVNFQFFTTLSLCAGLPTDSVSKLHMGASGLFIILIYCRYLTCVINFRGNCQKEVSDFINDGGKDTQAICTSISCETPEIKKRSLRAMIVLVLPGKKKGETENFLSYDTPHSFFGHLCFCNSKISKN